MAAARAMAEASPADPMEVTSILSFLGINFLLESFELTETLPHWFAKPLQSFNKNFKAF